MQVRVQAKGLVPRVQHRDEADLGAQMLRVGGDRAQRLGGGPEQDPVDDGGILQGDRSSSSLPRPANDGTGTVATSWLVGRVNGGFMIAPSRTTPAVSPVPR